MAWRPVVSLIFLTCAPASVTAPCSRSDTSRFGNSVAWGACINGDTSPYPSYRNLSRLIPAGAPLEGVWQRARPLVTAGEFLSPPCAGDATRPANQTWWNASNCPVEDASYCDEWHALDQDCSGWLALEELSKCTTMYDAPSYLRLVPKPYPSYMPGDPPSPPPCYDVRVAAGRPHRGWLPGYQMAQLDKSNAWASLFSLGADCVTFSL